MRNIRINRTGLAAALAVLLGYSGRAAAQATVALINEPCNNSHTLVVDVNLTNSASVAVGGQFFLQYDNSQLQFVSAVPGDAPFTQQVFESVDTFAGTIDYAVGIPGFSSGVTAPPTRTMARITFNILINNCSAPGLVAFRASGPHGIPNRISDNQSPGQPILPLTLIDLPTVTLDLDAPEATSNGPISACYPDSASAIADALAHSSAIDNCTASPTPTVVLDGTCSATINVSFADSCGNISNTLNYNTRIDGAPPSLSCSDIVVNAGPGNCSAVVNYSLIVSDNCDPTPAVTCSIPSGSVFVGGVTHVSCHATDSCGNVSPTCNFSVTVNLTPTTLSLHTGSCNNGGFLIVSIDLSNACKVVVGGQYFLAFDPAQLQFVSANPGDAPFTRAIYQSIDTGLGHIDYATGIDNGGTGTSAPTTMARVTFRILTSNCNASGLVSFRPFGRNGALNELSDNEVPAQAVLPLALSNLAATTLDITGPTINGVPSNQTVECGSVPVGPATLPAVDNCDGSVTIATLNPDQITPGSCPQNYTVTRTWSATDSCGNTSTATQIIIVHDTIGPVISDVPADITLQCMPVELSALPASDSCDPTVTVATLNPDQVTPGDCPNAYVVTRTWTATDACGNQTTATQILNIIDTTPPTILCPPDLTLQCESDVPPHDFAGGTADDECRGPPLVTWVNDATDNKGPNHVVITRTYQAADSCGNVSTCTQTITVNDTTPPVISGCPGNIVTNTNTIGCAAIVSWTPPTTTDNCGDASIVQTTGPASGSTFTNGSVTKIQYTATDATGNTALCSFTVTVHAFPDMNDDGFVNLLDVPIFANVLIGVDPTPYRVARADVNCDGLVNGLDIQGFVNLIVP